jgi:PLP dependent protein
MTLASARAVLHFGDTKDVEHLRENLSVVEERLARALARSNRRREEITLVAVVKTFPASATLAAYQAGLRDFGENYVQEFERKAPELAGLAGARYHLIGHLQSNKVNKAVPLFDCVQTVDSAKLAQRLDRAGKALDVMIEVKLSDEDAKHGCAPADTEALRDAILALPNLRLAGLMTMPPFFDDPEQSRPYFARLRELAGRLGVQGLSMGMSNDFEVAVEEGATHIRLGTVLFGKRSPRV